jgi:TonB family protein
MNRVSLRQRLARWGAVAACALAESGATAYAASALVHVVVLGGALIIAPWANSGVGFSVAQGNGGTGQHASPIGSAGGSEATDVIRFELLKPRPVVSGQLPVEVTPAASEPALVTDSRPVASEAEPVLTARVLPLNALPDLGATARYERPEVEAETTQTQQVSRGEIKRREDTDGKVPADAEPQPAKIARRDFVDAPARPEVRVELPEVEEISGRGITGGGTGAGTGAGNGGGSGLAGGSVDSLPREGPRNPGFIYPPELLLARVEAVVMLRVKVSPEGTVNSAIVSQSSGWKSMDDSALTTIRLWRFEPARRRGVAVEFEIELPVRFHLRRS